MVKLAGKMHDALSILAVGLVATCLVPVQGADSGDEVVPAEFRWAQRKDRILLTIELQVRQIQRHAKKIR